MITKEDVLRVAYDLKQTLTDEQVDWILKEYPNYQPQYPQDNWSYIVEIMIDDVTGPILRYIEK